MLGRLMFPLLLLFAGRLALEPPVIITPLLPEGFSVKCCGCNARCPSHYFQFLDEALERAKECLTPPD